MINSINHAAANSPNYSGGGGLIPLIPETTELEGQPLVIVLDLGIGYAENTVKFRLPVELVTGYGLDGPLNHTSVITKDYVIDYTSALANVIMETESSAGSLTYRYAYGLQKLSVSVSPITTGAGNLIQNGRVKLWYHQDRLGSTDFLTNNIDGKVTSYVTYDDWGAPIMKAILKMGVRELDLVTNYTGHPYDPVLGVLTGPSGPAAERSSALRACFNGASLTTQRQGCMTQRIDAGYRWIRLVALLRTLKHSCSTHIA